MCFRGETLLILSTLGITEYELIAPECVVDAGEACDDDYADAGDGCADCSTDDEQALCLATLGASDACAQCSCTKCQAPALGCYANGNATDLTLCKSVVECARDSGCVNPECFCGESSLLTCLSGAADGPCAAQISAAAKTSSLADISARTTDLNFPLGRANQLMECRSTNCAAECAR